MNWTFWNPLIHLYWFFRFKTRIIVHSFERPLGFRWAFDPIIFFPLLAIFWIYLYAKPKTAANCEYNDAMYNISTGNRTSGFLILYASMAFVSKFLCGRYRELIKVFIIFLKEWMAFNNAYNIHKESLKWYWKFGRDFLHKWCIIR